MTWVKICGITNLEDALLAVDAGADAVGFVFHEKSPRNVSVETVREIVSQLADKVEKVGVFVHAPESPDGLEAVGFTYVQAYSDQHGRYPLLEPPFLDQVRSDVIPVLNMDYAKAEVMLGVGFHARQLDRIKAVLLDSGSATAGVRGGTGRTFNWAIGAAFAECWNNLAIDVIVAGGLDADNVREAIETMKPFGVDVSSGVEASPGKKDPAKVRAFIRAVREADGKAR